MLLPRCLRGELNRKHSFHVGVPACLSSRPKGLTCAIHMTAIQVQNVMQVEEAFLNGLAQRAPPLRGWHATESADSSKGKGGSKPGHVMGWSDCSIKQVPTQHCPAGLMEIQLLPSIGFTYFQKRLSRDTSSPQARHLWAPKTPHWSQTLAILSHFAK